MKTKLILVLALVLSGGFTVVHAEATVSNKSLLPSAVAGTITNQRDLVMLQDYLFKAGDRFNCYFTIESFDENNGGPLFHHQWINAKDWIATDSKIRNINDLKSFLEGRLPNYEVVVDQKTPHILHFIQKKLNLLEDYVLNDHTSLTYSGFLGPGRIEGGEGLAVVLGRRLNGRIGYQNVGVLNITLFDDYYTSITVNAKDSIVRNILTDFVPLSKYKRIIWLAKTPMAGTPTKGNIVLKTTVQYFGQKKLPPDKSEQSPPTLYQHSITPTFTDDYYRKLDEWDKKSAKSQISLEALPKKRTNSIVPP